jgi:hypothetical protein
MEGVIASGGAIDPKYGVPIETYVPPNMILRAR